MQPRLAVRDISFFERPVPFTKPFRFGAVVINASMQVFVRVEIEVEGKGTSVGASAELMASKWFDKRAHLSPRQTVGELRRSLAIARDLYLSRPGFDTAFGVHAARIAAQVAIRHTVGLDDKVVGSGGVADTNENAGARYFKLKLNGDPEHDASRLPRI